MRHRAANWLKQQYEEEQMHATRIYNYLVDQGAHVVLQEIPRPPSDFGTILDVEIIFNERGSKVSL